MYSVAIFMFLFESGVFLAHYHVMSEGMLKSGQTEEMIITSGAIVWGGLASLVPLLGFFALFALSKSKDFFLQLVASESKDGTTRISAILILISIFLIVIFTVEISVFYDYFYTPTSLFNQSTVDIKTLLKSIGVSMGHFFITGCLVGVLYIWNFKNIQNWLQEKLGE